MAIKLDTYLVQTPSSGREVAVPAAKPEAIYIDQQSGEVMNVTGREAPLAPSPSNLPWAVENLRFCGCVREQLVQNDVNDCPYCEKRLDPVA